MVISWGGWWLLYQIVSQNKVIDSQKYWWLTVGCFARSPNIYLYILSSVHLLHTGTCDTVLVSPDSLVLLVFITWDTFMLSRVTDCIWLIFTCFLSETFDTSNTSNTGDPGDLVLCPFVTHRDLWHCLVLYCTVLYTILRSLDLAEISLGRREETITQSAIYHKLVFLPAWMFLSSPACAALQCPGRTAGRCPVLCLCGLWLVSHTIPAARPVSAVQTQYRFICFIARPLSCPAIR